MHSQNLNVSFARELALNSHVHRVAALTRRPQTSPDLLRGLCTPSTPLRM